MHISAVAALLSALFALAGAISYRCENNQVLIVQSFGNDTIRMHCQKLNLCGLPNLVGFFKNIFSDRIDQTVSNLAMQLRQGAAIMRRKK